MPYVFLKKDEVERFISVVTGDPRDEELRQRLAASIQPRRHFTVDLRLDSPEFAGHGTSNGIMQVLRHIQGMVATGRWTGKVENAGGQPIGEFLLDWCKDPSDKPPS